MEKPIWPSTLSILLKSKKGSKDFYNLINNEKCDPQIAHKVKWERIINNNISDKEWTIIYKHCFKSIEDNEIIWLQYRIVNQILGTKSLRYKMNVIENNLCRFCNSFEETITHTFVQCQYSKILWEEVKNWVRSTTNITFDISEKTLILGLHPNLRLGMLCM